jgi:chromosome segregation ATPase
MAGFKPGVEITRDLIASNPDAALEQIHALIAQSQESSVVIGGLKESITSMEGTRTDLEKMAGQHAEALAAAAEKDKTIAALQGELEDTNAQKTSLITGNSELTQAYRDLVLKNEPSLPPSLISGGTLNEIQASVEAARGVVQHVQSAASNPAASGRMPAGAPMRTITPDTKTMTAIEKITYGARQAAGEEMTG